MTVIIEKSKDYKLELADKVRAGIEASIILVGHCTYQNYLGTYSKDRIVPF